MKRPEVICLKRHKCQVIEKMFSLPLCQELWGKFRKGACRCSCHLKLKVVNRIFVGFVVVVLVFFVCLLVYFLKKKKKKEGEEEPFRLPPLILKFGDEDPERSVTCWRSEQLISHRPRARPLIQALITTQRNNVEVPPRTWGLVTSAYVLSRVLPHA